MSDFIYLDHNSTSPIDPTVARVMAEYYSAQYANPASQHRPGQLARRELESLRFEIASMLGAVTSGMQTDSLVFTSGGTESDNLALFGLAAAGRKRLADADLVSDDDPVRILISSIEHPAVFAAGEQLARLGYEVIRFPVDQHGVCKLDELARLIEDPDAPAVALVSLMLANNETGAIQPVVEAAKICRAAGILIHTDAVQAVGKIPVDFRKLGVDALSFTAHKLAGPRGIGGLLLRFGVSPEPMLFGGFQQTTIRPGTEDVALAAGMCRALKLFHADPAARYQHLVGLRDAFQTRISAAIPGVVINSLAAERTPQTLNLAFPGLDRQSFLMSADMQKLAISTGSACASGSSEPSPVLMAMGLDLAIVECSIRVSFGYSNTMEEVDEAFERINQIVAKSTG